MWRSIFCGTRSTPPPLHPLPSHPCSCTPGCQSVQGSVPAKCSPGSSYRAAALTPQAGLCCQRRCCSWSYIWGLTSPLNRVLLGSRYGLKIHRCSLFGRRLPNTNLMVFLDLRKAWMPLGAIRECSPGQKREEESAQSCRDEENEQKKGREREESKKRTSFSFWASIQHLSGT